jgi:hypothetical protein
MNIFALILLSVTLVSTMSFTTKGARLLSRKDILCRGPGMSCFMSAQNFPPLDASTKEMIERLVNSSKVVLFMKGTKAFPQW